MNANHSGRKRMVKSFLDGMRRMLFIETGNCLHMVSYPTWDDGIHSDRKLFAKGFLYGVGSMVYIATGNCLRKVSYTAWGEWYT